MSSGSAGQTPPSFRRGSTATAFFGPALPAAIQLGARLETYRAELLFSSVPIVLYAERLRAWASGSDAPNPVGLAGVELRLERLVPLDLPDSLSLYVGVARIRSDEPRGLVDAGVWRPGLPSLRGRLRP